MSNVQYIVAGTIGGYAREDADQVVVYGVFTDQAIANKMKLVTGGKVYPVVLDAIPPGYYQTMKELNLL